MTFKRMVCFDNDLILPVDYILVSEGTILKVVSAAAESTILKVVSAAAESTILKVVSAVAESTILKVVSAAVLFMLEI
jgi:hypothetical protein